MSLRTGNRLVTAQFTNSFADIPLCLSQHTLLQLLTISRWLVRSILLDLLMHTRLVLRITQPTTVGAVLAIGAVSAICIVSTARATSAVRAVLLIVAVGAVGAILAVGAICKGLVREWRGCK